MYKRASRRHGGSLLNIRARVARKTSNPTIERAAARTPFVRKIILEFGETSDKLVEGLSDDDLALLLFKFLDGYTSDRTLVSIAEQLRLRSGPGHKSFEFLASERAQLQKAFPEIIRRWSKYRTRYE